MRDRKTMDRWDASTEFTLIKMINSVIWYGKSFISNIEVDYSLELSTFSEAARQANQSTYNYTNIYNYIVLACFIL